MATSPSRVFTIAAGESFLTTLAHALVDGELGFDLPLHDPLALARCTVYLPTRRAMRAFRPILASRIGQLTGQQAMLLPRLVPLGDGDEAETLLALSAGASLLPPVMPPLQRRMMLTRMVGSWARTVNRAMLSLPEGRALLPRSLAEAFALSADLASAIDEFGLHDVAFESVGALDLHKLDRYWTLTAQFLALAGQDWPRVLAELGLIEGATRDSLLVDAMIAHWQGDGRHPVVAAGSTGSIPSTARLLEAIARLDKGAVVLPDLDLAMDETSWEEVIQAGGDGEAAHPQAILGQLLTRFALPRSQVKPLPPAHDIGFALKARRALLTEAFRPVATTSEWATLDARMSADRRRAAFADIDLIAAPDERMEALAIAAILRRTLETPERTASLVTPDRSLAERVAHELRRWDIDVDDTAGVALRRTPAGVLASLVLRLAQPEPKAQDLVALLAMSLAGLGLAEPERQRAASTIEIGALRGQPPLQTLSALPDLVAGIAERIAAGRHVPMPRRRLSAADIALAHRAAGTLAAALQPFADAPASGPVTRFAALHRAALLAVACDDEGRSLLDGLPETQLLFDLLDELQGLSADAPEGSLEDYADLFDEIAAERTLRVSHRQHPRLKILGLLEARLLEADVVVLGGLCDGVWPPEVKADAFLNRSIRRALGLPSPERRIGQTAHDFVEAAMAGHVVLARAVKSGTAQTIPSRFLQRLAAVADRQAWADAQSRGDAILAQVRQLDQPEQFAPCGRPEPVVAAARLPVRLSVTEIETLYRDPYAIHARHVLGLQPLEPLEQTLGHGDRGTLLHDIVARFADIYAATLPEDRPAVLERIATEAFAPYMDDLEVQQFWWPAWKRLAGDVLAWEAARRPQIVSLATEAGARWRFGLDDGSDFTLTARADRIEQLQDGSLRLIDFKTGTLPRKADIASGMAPQSTLQAIMAANAAFGRIGEGAVSWSGYLALKPGHLDQGALALAGDELATLAEKHFNGLKHALMAYRSGQRGFASRIAPADARRAGDYDHLARVDEWQRDDGEADE